MTFAIRPLIRADWERVRAIYEEGIATGDATFETEAPGWEAWDRNHLAGCRLVAELAGRVVGWAALAPVSGRCVYGGVAEVSVYVGAEGPRRGARGRHSSPPWSRRPSARACGRFRPGSSPRTRRAFACTSGKGSVAWGRASAWAGSMAAGGTCSCLNAAAPRSASSRAAVAEPEAGRWAGLRVAAPGFGSLRRGRQLAIWRGAP